MRSIPLEICTPQALAQAFARDFLRRLAGDTDASE
jgi:hypothetical protein